MPQSDLYVGLVFISAYICFVYAYVEQSIDCDNVCWALKFMARI